MARAATLGLAALGVLGALVSGRHQGEPSGDEPPIWERIDLPSVAACGGCHLEVYREWSQSLHAKAWTNANVRAATEDFAQAACRPCHSPLPVLPRGLGKPPAYRAFNQDDGVHCLSCHGMEGGVAAARTLEAPCKPRYEPRFLEADSCYPCHEPTHDAFTEYETSDAFAVGVRCVDCHMQPAPDRPGRSHGPSGGMNAAFVERALAWDVRVADGVLVVELRNRTGHKFPGEIPSRSFVLSVRFDDAEPQRTLLRKPHKGEEREDDRLLPDETRALRFPVPDGARAADVRLLFLPLPLLRDDQGFELGRRALELGR